MPVGKALVRCMAIKLIHLENFKERIWGIRVYE